MQQVQTCSSSTKALIQNFIWFKVSQTEVLGLFAVRIRQESTQRMVQRPVRGQKLRSQTRSDSMRVQYLHQTEGGAVTNKRATAVYRLKDKKKKNKQNKENHNKAEGK